MSRRHLVHSSVLALSLGATLLAGASAGASTPSVSALIANVKAAMAKQAGVHLDVTSKTGTATTTVRADIGTKSGTETFTSGTESVIITITPSNAYLSGTKTGLITLMGLTATQQKLVGSSWIVMKSGTSPYSAFQPNLTSASYSAFLPAVAGTAISTGTLNGQSVYKLSWSSKATSTTKATSSVLYISMGATPLPLYESVTGSGSSGSTTFSKWGQKVNPSVPSSGSTITYAKVFPG